MAFPLILRYKGKGHWVPLATLKLSLQLQQEVDTFLLVSKWI